MKFLAVLSIFTLLILSVFINLFQYKHIERLQGKIFVDEFEARAFHYTLDQEEEQLHAMTQQVMDVSNIHNDFKAKHYARIYIEAAKAYDLDPRLLLFLTLIESEFDPHAKSKKGALGMTQIMPKVWLKTIEFVSNQKDLMDPYLNIHAGALVLRHYLDRADGNVKLALLMYNRGEGAVSRDILQGRDPSNGFARKVLFGHEYGAQSRTTVSRATNGSSRLALAP